MTAGNETRDEAERVLLHTIRECLPELSALLEKVAPYSRFEDGFCRFCHQSYKLCGLQEHTLEIGMALRSLAPGRPLNDRFQRIARDGGGRIFWPEHNRGWLQETAPIVEAFFHARAMDLLRQRRRKLRIELLERKEHESAGCAGRFVLRTRLLSGE